MTKIFQHDINHWSLEEFIRLIVNETEIAINNEQLRKHILHEIKKNIFTENQYQPPEEIDTFLADATERIVGVLSNTIAHISLEMSLPIIFWVRIALSLRNQYQINIDSVLENYTKWRNNEGKNLQLLYSPRISKGKSEIIPFDLFLANTGYQRISQILKTSEWHLDEIKGIVAKKAKKAKKAKDPYCNIGEPAFIKLKEMMKKAAFNIEIKNFLPYHGDGKVKHLFYGKREDLYNILVEKYSLDIAFSSYCQASPNFVNVTQKKLNLTTAQIQIIKLRKSKPLRPLKAIHKI